MTLELNKKPQGVTIIHGFPGFGLVGTITTEFLIRHLDCELIGRKWFEELPAAIAIHNKEIVQPVGIYYNEEYNLVIVHSITGGPGIEWKIADFLIELSDELETKEFIALEGVGTIEEKEIPDIFYYTVDEKQQKKLDGLEIKPLKEGVIMGVTSALMLKSDKELTAYFVETHSNFPDSKAAAELIKLLDKVLDLKVDPEPLYESAEKFEKNFNKIIEQSQVAKKQIGKKQMNYVG